MPIVDVDNDMAATSVVNWGAFERILHCPECRKYPLELKPKAVRCPSCELDFTIESGVIDFVGAGAPPRPRLYRNPFYQRFIASQDAVHAAHYKAGSFSSLVETAMKRNLFRLVRPAHGISVDLGCGLGDGFKFIGPEHQVVGVDYSLSLLKKTRLLHPSVALVRADLARLPFRDGSLGRVFANAVLEHVFELDNAVDEIQRCLSQDGTLYVAVPTEGSLAVAAARLVTSRRNARLIGLTPAQSREAQRIDHCNSVEAIDNTLRKHFTVEASAYWPLRVRSIHVNLSKSFRLRHLPDEACGVKA